MGAAVADAPVVMREGVGDDLPAPHQFAVSRWIGRSITISGKHYANAVPDELFERAAIIGTLGLAPKDIMPRVPTSAAGAS